jgi:MoaA/NifB/PqqE/SkfB family radical SAM enzyme
LRRILSDEKYLTGLIKEIVVLEESEFDLTTEEVRCQYCLYRSLCQRGIRAGALHEWMQETEGDEGFALDFEFDQISEIEF